MEIEPTTSRFYNHTLCPCVTTGHNATTGHNGYIIFFVNTSKTYKNRTGSIQFSNSTFIRCSISVRLSTSYFTRTDKAITLFYPMGTDKLVACPQNRFLLARMKLLYVTALTSFCYYTPFIRRHSPTPPDP